MEHHFRIAVSSDIPHIWHILEQAIIRRREEGSDQWQNGYPNPEVLQKDIDNGVGYVLTQGETIVGYSAVLVNDEPAYANIEGEWLTNDDFLVIHRVAVSENHLGKGLAQKIFGYIEKLALSKNIHSIKVDTNHDNIAMLRVFEKTGYSFCGIVYLRGCPRRAYEKVVSVG